MLFCIRFTVITLILYSFTVHADVRREFTATSGKNKGAANTLPLELFKATYKGKHSGLSITLVRTLRQEQSTIYQLQSEADAFMSSISELSTFSRTDTSYLPYSYRYHRKVFGRSSKQSLLFNWKELTAKYTREDKPHKNAVFDIPLGVLDPSLYQLKLQQELNQGKKIFKFTFAKDSRVKDFEFQVLEKTEYTLNNKTYAALNLSRINQPDKRQTLITVIPELHHQIAHINHTETDGTDYSIKLVDFEFNAEALPAFYSSRLNKAKVKENDSLNNAK